MMDHDELEQLLREAEQSSGNEELLMPIIERLERRAAEQGTPEHWYACAYAWYLHPRRIERQSWSARVDDRLMRALSAQPEHFLALLYLGHNSYDRGDYRAAREYFAKARNNAPKDYIGLKSYEMVVCCDVMLEHRSV